MRQIELQDIPQGNYQGYLWYSDELRPRIFDDNDILSIESKENAFIGEGMLWQPTTHTSFHITFHDGVQHVYTTEVAAEDMAGHGQTTHEQYVAHRMPGIAFLDFVRYWKSEADPFCEGFEVLVPGVLAFTEFIKK